jgi:methionyl-tRNA formyltransferase
MNIVFFGTAEFAIPSLKALIDSPHKVVAVVTQPDRARWRSLKVSPPVTKVFATTHGIPVYQPENASSPDSITYLKGLAADLFVVIAFGQILKKDVLAIPRHYAINLHGSLLPKYRGAAPTNWAIINGDSVSGVTIIKMNERLDEGDIILKREINIDPEDTNITLSEELSEIGAKALLEAVDLIEKGKAICTKQDDAQVTFAPKLKKEDGLIDWRQSAAIIHNKVKGLIPWPGAYVYLGGKALKILNTETCDCPTNAAEAGEVLDVVTGKGIIVKAGLGAIIIKYLQLEGKKVLDADAFVRGHRILKGDTFR